MKRHDVALITCQLDHAEHDIVVEMMCKTGIVTVDNLARLGLFHLARHLDIRIAPRIFAMRPATPMFAPEFAGRVDAPESGAALDAPLAIPPPGHDPQNSYSCEHEYSHGGRCVKCGLWPPAV